MIISLSFQLLSISPLRYRADGDDENICFLSVSGTIKS